MKGKVFHVGKNILKFSNIVMGNGAAKEKLFLHVK
jgi:hypothetical protein